MPQSFRLATPTTLHTLLDDEEYRTYFRSHTKQFSTPPMHPRWMIMAQTKDGKWRRGYFETFKAAYLRSNNLAADIRDFSIVSRARIFKPPLMLHKRLIEPGEEWCGRCRRPTYFFDWPGTRHPAIDLRQIMPNQPRCFFCGIRRDMQWTT